MTSVKLLIGERDPFMQRTLARSLPAGYDLHFVEDGAMLVETARALSPHLVVLEILLPTLDGLQVCRALKGNPATQRIPILVFTWLMAEERALQAGADAFLPKPLDSALFLDVIQRLLHRQGKPHDRTT